MKYLLQDRRSAKTQTPPAFSSFNAKFLENPKSAPTSTLSIDQQQHTKNPISPAGKIIDLKYYNNKFFLR
jgi:hypothetical protein